MKRLDSLLVVLAAIVTIGTLATWLATGRHYFTKFEVVEQIQVSVAADDPVVSHR